MKGKQALSAAILAVALSLMVGCGTASDDAFEPSAQARSYPIAGTVRGAEAGERRVTVAHEAIADFMDAMTMSFVVKEGWVAGAAKPGDRLTATLVVDGARSWIEGVSLITPPDGATRAGANDASAAGIGPATGTPLPDAPLVDQAGRTVRASDFAGRDLIVTFIYTHCPLPDFCPLMMTRLNEAAARLRKAGRRDEVQMVAISIDPARDTPDVMASYGRAHIRGEDGDPFHRWSLLTGSADNVKAWASVMALTYEPDGNEIAHGLRTAVVDRDGRIVGVLRGNQWTTNELMALLPARP